MIFAMIWFIITAHMSVRVVTDSTSGLSAELSKKFNITILPYYVISDHQSFIEDEKFDRIRYYRALSQQDDLPTTSHPGLKDIVEIYKKLLLQSNEPIMHLTISSKHTTTYELALQAKEQFSQAKIEVYDTKAATAHQALIALEAARLANSGTDVEGIVSFLEKNKGRISEVMVLNTLKYLAKGGRIQRAQYLLGSLLSTKPLIGYHSEGETMGFGRVRTHRAGLDFIIDKIKSDFARFGGIKLRAIIEDADNKQQADAAEEALRRNFNCEEIYRITMSVVSGTHLGPGAWGISYFVL